MVSCTRFVLSNEQWGKYAPSPERSESDGYRANGNSEVGSPTYHRKYASPRHGAGAGDAGRLSLDEPGELAHRGDRVRRWHGAGLGLDLRQSSECAHGRRSRRAPLHVQVRRARDLTQGPERRNPERPERFVYGDNLV